MGRGKSRNKGKSTGVGRTGDDDNGNDDHKPPQKGSAKSSVSTREEKDNATSADVKPPPDRAKCGDPTAEAIRLDSAARCVTHVVVVICTVKHKDEDQVMLMQSLLEPIVAGIPSEFRQHVPEYVVTGTQGAGIMLVARERESQASGRPSPSSAGMPQHRSVFNVDLGPMHGRCPGPVFGWFDKASSTLLLLHAPTTKTSTRKTWLSLAADLLTGSGDDEDLHRISTIVKVLPDCLTPSTPHVHALIRFVLHRPAEDAKQRLQKKLNEWPLENLLHPNVVHDALRTEVVVKRLRDQPRQLARLLFQNTLNEETATRIASQLSQRRLFFVSTGPSAVHMKAVVREFNQPSLLSIQHLQRAVALNNAMKGGSDSDLAKAISDRAVREVTSLRDFPKLPTLLQRLFNSDAASCASSALQHVSQQTHHSQSILLCFLSDDLRWSVERKCLQQQLQTYSRQHVTLRTGNLLEGASAIALQFKAFLELKDTTAATADIWKANLSAGNLPVMATLLHLDQMHVLRINPLQPTSLATLELLLISLILYNSNLNSNSPHGVPAVPSSDEVRTLLSQVEIQQDTLTCLAKELCKLPAGRIAPLLLHMDHARVLSAGLEHVLQLCQEQLNQRLMTLRFDGGAWHAGCPLSGLQMWVDACVNLAQALQQPSGTLLTKEAVMTHLNNQLKSMQEWYDASLEEFFEVCQEVSLPHSKASRMEQLASLPPLPLYTLYKEDMERLLQGLRHDNITTRLLAVRSALLALLCGVSDLLKWGVVGWLTRQGKARHYQSEASHLASLPIVRKTRGFIFSTENMQGAQLPADTHHLYKPLQSIWQEANGIWKMHSAQRLLAVRAQLCRLGPSGTLTYAMFHAVMQLTEDDLSSPTLTERLQRRRSKVRNDLLQQLKAGGVGAGAIDIFAQQDFVECGIHSKHVQFCLRHQRQVLMLQIALAALSHVTAEPPQLRSAFWPNDDVRERVERYQEKWLYGQCGDLQAMEELAEDAAVAPADVGIFGPGCDPEDLVIWPELVQHRALLSPTRVLSFANLLQSVKLDQLVRFVTEFTPDHFSQVVAHRAGRADEDGSNVLIVYRELHNIYCATREVASDNRGSRRLNLCSFIRRILSNGLLMQYFEYRVAETSSPSVPLVSQTGPSRQAKARPHQPSAQQQRGAKAAAAPRTSDTMFHEHGLIRLEHHLSEARDGKASGTSVARMLDFLKTTVLADDRPRFVVVSLRKPQFEEEAAPPDTAAQPEATTGPRHRQYRSLSLTTRRGTAPYVTPQTRRLVPDYAIHANSSRGELLITRAQLEDFCGFLDEALSIGTASISDTMLKLRDILTRTRQILSQVAALHEMRVFEFASENLQLFVLSLQPGRKDMETMSQRLRELAVLWGKIQAGLFKREQMDPGRYHLLRLSPGVRAQLEIALRGTGLHHFNDAGSRLPSLPRCPKLLPTLEPGQPGSRLENAVREKLRCMRTFLYATQAGEGSLPTNWSMGTGDAARHRRLTDPVNHLHLQVEGDVFNTSSVYRLIFAAMTHLLPRLERPPCLQTMCVCDDFPEDCELREEVRRFLLRALYRPTGSAQELGAIGSPHVLVLPLALERWHLIITELQRWPLSRRSEGHLVFLSIGSTQDQGRNYRQYMETFAKAAAVHTVTASMAMDASGHNRIQELLDHRNIDVQIIQGPPQSGKSHAIQRFLGSDVQAPHTLFTHTQLDTFLDSLIDHRYGSAWIQARLAPLVERVFLQLSLFGQAQSSSGRLWNPNPTQRPGHPSRPKFYLEVHTNSSSNSAQQHQESAPYHSLLDLFPAAALGDGSGAIDSSKAPVPLFASVPSSSTLPQLSTFVEQTSNTAAEGQDSRFVTPGAQCLSRDCAWLRKCAALARWLSQHPPATISMEPEQLVVVADRTGHTLWQEGWGAARIFEWLLHATRADDKRSAQYMAFARVCEPAGTLLLTAPQQDGAAWQLFNSDVGPTESGDEEERHQHPQPQEGPAPYEASMQGSSLSDGSDSLAGDVDALLHGNVHAGEQETCDQLPDTGDGSTAPTAGPLVQHLRNTLDKVLHDPQLPDGPRYRAAVGALCQAVEECFGHTAIRAVLRAYPMFVFSPLVMVRLLVLATHAALRLPLILEGETGVGKTYLLKIFFKLLHPDSNNGVHKGSRGDDPTLHTLDLQPSHTEKSVLRWLKDLHITHARQKSPPWQPSPKPSTVVFVDEINCCDVLDVVQAVMLDGLLDRHVLAQSVWVVGACNPSQDRDGRVGLYKVLPLTPSLRKFTWTLDVASSEDIRFTAFNALQQKLPSSLHESEEILPAARLLEVTYLTLHAWCCNGPPQHVQRGPWTQEIVPPSVRDVVRSATFAAEFCRLRLAGEQSTTVMWSTLLASATTFALRLPEAARCDFCTEVAKSYSSKAVSRTSAVEDNGDTTWLLQPLVDVIAACSDMLGLHSCSGVFVTQTLCENVFLMLLHAHMGLPLFLVGEAGTSKSISLALVSQCARAALDAQSGSGDGSLSAFADRISAQKGQKNEEGPPQQRQRQRTLCLGVSKLLCCPIMYVLQCSPQLSAHTLRGEFERAQEFSRGSGQSKEPIVVVLEEVGLSYQGTAKVPTLKVLHALLDKQCNLDLPREDRVPFFALSNTFLDAAKMNRGTVVLRHAAATEDLEQMIGNALCATLRGPISSTNSELSDIIATVKQLYADLTFSSQTPNSAAGKRRFYGLRDLYCMLWRLKTLGCRCNSRRASGGTVVQLWKAILAEFGGANGSITCPNTVFEAMRKVFVQLRLLIERNKVSQEEATPWLDICRAAFDGSGPCSMLREALQCPQPRYMRAAESPVSIGLRKRHVLLLCDDMSLSPTVLKALLVGALDSDKSHSSGRAVDDADHGAEPMHGMDSQGAGSAKQDGGARRSDIIVLSPPWENEVDFSALSGAVKSTPSASEVALKEAYLQRVLEGLSHPGVCVVRFPHLLADYLYDVINGHSASRVHSQPAGQKRTSWVHVRVPVGGRSRYVQMHTACRLVLVDTVRSAMTLPVPFLHRLRKIGLSFGNADGALGRPAQMRPSELSINIDMEHFLCEFRTNDAAPVPPSASRLLVEPRSHFLACKALVAAQVRGANPSPHHADELSDPTPLLPALPGVRFPISDSEHQLVEVLAEQEHYSRSRLVSLLTAAHWVRTTVPHLLVKQFVGKELFLSLLVELKRQGAELMPIEADDGGDDDLEDDGHQQGGDTDMPDGESAPVTADAAETNRPWAGITVYHAQTAEAIQGLLVEEDGDNDGESDGPAPGNGDDSTSETTASDSESEANDEGTPAQRTSVLLLYMDSSVFDTPLLVDLLEDLRYACGQEYRCLVVFREDVDMFARLPPTPAAFGWTYATAGFADTCLKELSDNPEVASLPIPLRLAIYDYDKHRVDWPEQTEHPLALLRAKALEPSPGTPQRATSVLELESKPFPRPLQHRVQRKCIKAGLENVQFSDSRGAGAQGNHHMMCIAIATLAGPDAHSHEQAKRVIASIGVHVQVVNHPTAKGGGLMMTQPRRAREVLDLHRHEDPYEPFIWKGRCICALEDQGVFLQAAFPEDLEFSARDMQQRFDRKLRFGTACVRVEDILSQVNRVFQYHFLQLWMRQYEMQVDTQPVEGGNVIVDRESSTVEQQCLVIEMPQVTAKLEASLKTCERDLVMACVIVPTNLSDTLNDLYRTGDRDMVWLHAQDMPAGAHVAVREGRMDYAVASMACWLAVQRTTQMEGGPTPASEQYLRELWRRLWPSIILDLKDDGTVAVKHLDGMREKHVFCLPSWFARRHGLPDKQRRDSHAQHREGSGAADMVYGRESRAVLMFGSRAEVARLAQQVTQHAKDDTEHAVHLWPDDMGVACLRRWGEQLSCDVVADARLSDSDNGHPPSTKNDTIDVAAGPDLMLYGGKRRCKQYIKELAQSIQHVASVVRPEPTRLLTDGVRVYDLPPLSENVPECVFEHMHRNQAMAQFQNMVSSNRRITRVQYVENDELQTRYEECKDEFRQREQLNTNEQNKEKWVFHGTPQANIEGILIEGLKVGGRDAGVGVAHGSAYGPGVYTAVSPDTPMGYSRNANAIIMAKALPGVQGSQGQGDSWRPRTDWIVFKSGKQLLPVYIVHFE